MTISGLMVMVRAIPDMANGPGLDTTDLVDIPGRGRWQGVLGWRNTRDRQMASIALRRVLSTDLSDFLNPGAPSLQLEGKKKVPACGAKYKARHQEVVPIIPRSSVPKSEVSQGTYIDNGWMVPPGKTRQGIQLCLLE
jgi:hypothetical protein